ncbi:hypothetical protein Tcan_06404 [Toxocara canis]|uniref:Uncharacterized protein n=1 Tax=Toxocara canis TaxID=6265 RepID=A0A0B2VR62_TOXCA|nr:hypothetical protein Tcan_06404 [Toxocara canis]
MRLFSVLCLLEALRASVAVLLAVTAGKCSATETKAEFDDVRSRCVNKTFFKMISETQLSAGMGEDSCQLRFGQIILRCYEGSYGAAVTVKKLADNNFRNGTGFSESCEENMTLSNVCIDGDRAVYLVMGCANWESPGQPKSDGGSDEAECGELLARVASTRTSRADRGKSTVYVILGVGSGLILLTLVVVFLVKRRRARKEKDKEATTGTTVTMGPSQQLSGIRDFMEGETVAEQTDLNSDGSRMAVVNRPVQPAEGTTTPQ